MSWMATIASDAIVREQAFDEQLLGERDRRPARSGAFSSLSSEKSAEAMVAP
jgi:hypothetical protein